jgi:hypothetical protein
MEPLVSVNVRNASAATGAVVENVSVPEELAGKKKGAPVTG